QNARSPGNPGLSLKSLLASYPRAATALGNGSRVRASRCGGKNTTHRAEHGGEKCPQIASCRRCARDRSARLIWHRRLVGVARRAAGGRRLGVGGTQPVLARPDASRTAAIGAPQPGPLIGVVAILIHVPARAAGVPDSAGEGGPQLPVERLGRLPADLDL